MPDVPNQPVVGGVKYVMQGNRQLDRAQPGRKMAAAGRHAMNQKLTQFLRQIG